MPVHYARRIRHELVFSACGLSWFLTEQVCTSRKSATTCGSCKRLPPWKNTMPVQGGPLLEKHDAIYKEYRP